MKNWTFKQRVGKLRKQQDVRFLLIIFCVIVFLFLSLQAIHTIEKIIVIDKERHAVYPVECVIYEEVYPYDLNSPIEQKEYNKKIKELRKKYPDVNEFLQKVEELRQQSIMENAAVLVKADAKYIGEYVITAYCPCEKCCGEYAKLNHGIGSAGTKLKSNHSVASALPEGTKIIMNDKVYVSEDRPADYIIERYNGKVIDVYFDTHQEALNFGKQKAEIYKI